MTSQMNNIIYLTMCVHAGFLWNGFLLLDNGVALTPPMGWMSWQRYRCITDCGNFPNECIR